VAALAKEVNAVSVAVSLPTGTDNAGVSPFLLAIQDSLYVDERFKKVPEEGFPKLAWKSLVLLGSTDSVVQNAALTNKLTNMVASGVQYAKDLVGKLHAELGRVHSFQFANMFAGFIAGAPPCAKTPVAIADLIKVMAREHKLEVKVLGKVTADGDAVSSLQHSP
jgi:hypothetical protein